MLIESLAVSPFMSNCFVLGCEETHKGVIIDPGDEIARIAQRAEAMKLEIGMILATHGHMDHIGAAAEAVLQFEADFYLHSDDFFFAESIKQRAMMWGLGPKEPPPLEHTLSDGLELTFGNCTLKVLHTPGHSPGSVCFQSGEHIFTGDTLFEGSVGRTDLEGGSTETLLASIKNKLLPLPDDTQLHPGHGYSTSLGRERKFNPFINGAGFV